MLSISFIMYLGPYFSLLFVSLDMVDQKTFLFRSCLCIIKEAIICYLSINDVVVSTRRKEILVDNRKKPSIKSISEKLYFCKKIKCKTKWDISLHKWCYIGILKQISSTNILILYQHEIHVWLCTLFCNSVSNIERVSSMSYVSFLNWSIN